MSLSITEEDLALLKKMGVQKYTESDVTVEFWSPLVDVPVEAPTPVSNPLTPAPVGGDGRTAEEQLDLYGRVIDAKVP